MHVLIVKITSMGDLIHALPALTDAQRAIPGIRFDWVADQAFADIPRLHAAVDKIIPTAHRRWKREKWKTLKSGALVKAIRDLREKRYDAVIDAQGNLKSAVVTLLARGHKFGMDKHSIREKFADLPCDLTFSIPLNQHAIARQRQLFAKALHYPLPTTAPDFGIESNRLPALSLSLPSPYLVFIPSTTWETKHWPESHWKKLITLATQAGYQLMLPWGNDKEADRAKRLAEAAPDQCTVLPRLSIPELATLFLGAAGVVSVDTGLGHLAAALNVPGVHLYGPTNPALIGATGENQIHLVARFPCAPCYLQSCKFGADSACFMKDLPPEQVFEALKKALL
jgi:heptosyltransferase-1